MPFVLTTSSVVMCPHAGQVKHAPSQLRVLVQNAPALTQADVSFITACPFTIPPSKPSPCIQVRWSSAATRVFAGTTPLLVQTAVGLCVSSEQAPQGPPIANPAQIRVQAI